MKKFYLLFFILSLCTTEVNAVQTTTIVCFNDANNNGIKDATETVVTSSLDFMLLDSVSVFNYPVHYCGAPLTLTFSTSQSHYYLFFRYNFDQYSNFWTPLSPATNWAVYYQYVSTGVNFNSIAYIPIPPNFGTGYLPTYDNLVDPAATYSYNCISDSIDFDIKLGILDSTCMSVNNYTYQPNTGLGLDLFMNNVLVHSYSIPQTNTPGSQSVGSSTVWYNSNVLTVRLTNLTYSVGVNNIKYVVKNVPGYAVNATVQCTFTNNVNAPCGQLNGYSFLDCNGNCVQDAGEFTNNSYTSYNFTVSSTTNTFNLGINGYFTTVLPYGNYTLTGSGPCPPSLSTFTIPTTSFVTLPQPTLALIWDHQTNVWGCCGFPGPGAVPGGTFVAGAQAHLANVYCSAPTVYPTKLKMVLAPDMFYIAPYYSSPAPSNTIAAATGDTLVWNLSATPGFQIFYAAVGVKTTAVVGTPYTITSIITPHNDLYIADDTHTMTRNYGGPFDPNNKESQHPNMLSDGNILTPVLTPEMVYTINFQNLGNGPAQNVYIRDTISANLNLGTFKVLNSSYPVTSQVNNTTREVLFQFNNIFLPSGNASSFINRGYVTYQIEINSNLPVGTSLKNRAHIYFDFNNAVSTNQTINTLVNTTGIHKNFNGNDFYIYPNPTSGNLFIRSNAGITSFDVFDLVGKKVLTGDLDSGSIPTNELEKGIYILNLYTNDGQKMTTKFIRSGN